MSSGTSTTNDSPESSSVSQKIQALSDEFDKLTIDRHTVGAQEYGQFKFLENDTLEMLEEELADIANYARYTFIKVRILREALAKHAAGVDTSTESMLGELDQLDVEPITHGYNEVGDY